MQTRVVEPSSCRLLELNPGAKIMEQARQVLTACEKAPSDALKINYDPRNPFDVCSITFTPVYKGSKYAEDPYTGGWPAALCCWQTRLADPVLHCTLMRFSC